MFYVSIILMGHGVQLGRIILSNGMQIGCIIIKFFWHAMRTQPGAQPRRHI